jgi:transposase
LWLLKQLRPAQKTRATLRRDHLNALRQVCRACPLLCTPLDLLAGALVAIAGRTCTAGPAQERHCTPSKLQRLLPQIDAHIEGYLQALERGDTEEDHGTSGGARAEHLQANIAGLQERTLLYQAFQAQLLTSAEAQLSRPAPDRRAMKRGKGRGTEVCDNVQTAVDAKHTLMLAGEVTNDTSERDGRSPMALAAKAVLERPCEGVADRGDDHGDEVPACVEAGSTPSVARPITSANKKLGLFSQDDFHDARATDPAQWPAGEPLTFRVDTVERGRHLRYEATAACKACPLTQAGTRSTEGRRIPRWVDAPWLEAMAQRVHRRPEGMKRRKTLVEHPFGTMKRWWDAGDFCTRGLAKVRAALSVTV